MKLLVLSLLTLAFAPISQAYAFNGSIGFSGSDIRRHQNGISTILDTAAKCLQNDLDKHHLFMQRYGVSAFYGENASFAKVEGFDDFGQKTSRPTSIEEKRNQLRSYGVSEQIVQQLVPSRCRKASDCALAMQPESCVGLALKCLQQGFAAAGQSDIWANLRAFTRQNGVTGNSLQFGLQRLGWRLVYWNPNPSLDRAWDASERANYPKNPLAIWGRHEANYREVMSSRVYGDLRVDDVTSGVGFGTGVPEIARRAPFFVGIAHMGYHVFPGSYGQVVEAHSTRQVNDPREVQTSAFSPLTPGAGPQGGPRSTLPGGYASDTYRSGVIAIPPGY
jgi:hypothetical protein